MGIRQNRKTSNVDLLKIITELFRFKLIKDKFGNEYVLNDNNPLKSIESINDKTAFEAVENHVHIIDKVNGNEFETICLVGQVLGKVLICYLEKLYPDKKFVVFVTVTVNDSFIIRFHQKWANEPYYYDTSYDYENDTKVLMFES